MDHVQESSRNLLGHEFPARSVPADLGARIRDERFRRRWTQGRLAEKAGISRAAIYRAEAIIPNGRAPGRIRADTLFRIARALDMQITELVPEWPEWDPVAGNSAGSAARELRRANGRSIAEIAARIGVSEATLSRFERDIGESPTFVRRLGDELVSCNEELAQALGPASS